MKVIVVGAGVLGLSVARELALAGEDVLVLDQRGAGAGTSSATFAWVNSYRRLDPDYHRLGLAGMAEHAALAARLRGAPSYFRSGALQWADAASEGWLAENVERLTSLGYPVRFVTAAEAMRIAGGVRVPAGVTSLAYCPGEGYVLPDVFVRNLLADAERHGARYAIGRVAAFEDRPGGVSVTLDGGSDGGLHGGLHGGSDGGLHGGLYGGSDGGQVLTGDRLVLAAGRWSERLAAAAGIDLPMVTGTGRGSQTVGLLGYARSPSVGLRCVIHGPGLNLRPAGGGRTVLQALDLNAQVDPEDPPAADGEPARTLARRFSALLPDGDARPRVDLRVGFRSLPADGHTIAGCPAGRPRVYCLVSHSGITLAPLLGRLVAAEIAGGEEQDLLRAFRPTRFSGVGQSDIEMVRHATRLGEQ